MSPFFQISSDSRLNELESHFRVRAGPGAGKTFWLVNHIKNVVARSKQLSGTSRIACISYTNVAAEEIIKRLGAAADRVEVSTIHSFLYRNVVKPYLCLLKNEDGSPLVNYALVDGHDEHRPSYPCIKEWLQDIGQGWISRAQESLLWHLNRRRWVYDEGSCEWRWDLPHTIKKSPPLPSKITQGMGRYKIPYWRKGIIDHDDVLYFSFRILDEHQELLGFLSARYPYLFIDEFQDTNPVQTQMVMWISEQGTVAGVIGDSEQAIFGFQGARRDDFERFNLPGSKDYEIRNNRRSTNHIIALLNHVRRDGLQQLGLRSVEGDPVRVLVGTAEAVFAKAGNFIQSGEEFAVLARKNMTVHRFRCQVAATAAVDLWQKLEECDRDKKRFLEPLVRGMELARGGLYSRAVSEAIKGIRVRNGILRDPLNYTERVTIVDRQAISLGLLEHLLTHYEYLISQCLSFVYEKLGDVLRNGMAGLSLKRVVRGKFKEFAEQTPFGQLSGNIVLDEEPRLVRTIHKAKATEFANVLVHFESPNELAKVIDPVVLPNTEEEQEGRRIAYVGLSRARDRLFICLERLDAKEEKSLACLGIEVIRC